MTLSLLRLIVAVTVALSSFSLLPTSFTVITPVLLSIEAKLLLLICHDMPMMSLPPVGIVVSFNEYVPSSAKYVFPLSLADVMATLLYDIYKAFSSSSTLPHAPTMRIFIVASIFSADARTILPDTLAFMSSNHVMSLALTFSQSIFANVRLPRTLVADCNREMNE